MNKAKTFIAILIAAAVLGAYLIVARNSPPPAAPGESTPIFSH